MMNQWNQGYSNYVIAGGDCICSLFSNFIAKHNDPKFFDDESLKAVFHNTIDRFLYSFGTGLSYTSKKISKNHVKRISRIVDTIKSCKFMDDCNLYIDSGGFQVAMGAIEPNDMPLFIELYHNFLVDNSDKYEKAFSLDLPPGPTSSVFKSYNQIEELNRTSYNMVKSLPQNVKDKMLYIHHFRTPSLYETWHRFLWDENMAEGCKNFATGGIVASSSTDLAIPIIIYTIPLSEVLKYAIQNNMQSFDFHVLGGANFIDIFYHKLFSYHIKQVHNIDVRITYDSSTIFKGLAIGRFCPVFKSDGILHRLDLHSNTLHLKYDGNLTAEDVIYNEMNNIANHCGLGTLNPELNPIYDLERNTFNRAVHMYLMMCIMNTYRQAELYCDEYVQNIYPLYRDDKIDEFDKKCNEIASKFNQGKLTKKMQVKSYSVYKSLQILTDLNMEYNRFLINKFMSNDDNSSMIGDGLLTF